MADDSAQPDTGGEFGEGNFGEGNYKAAQNFREAQEAFAADPQRVRDKAREAADALDGDEAAELEKAAEAARDGRSV